MKTDHPKSAAKEADLVHADAADPSKSITKSQLRALVTSTAFLFRHRYGIGLHGPNKDVVLCIATGHFHLPTIFYATIAADGVFSSSNPGSTPKELAFQLNQVHAKLVFCTEETRTTAIAAVKLVNLPLSRIVVFSSGHHGGPSLSLVEAHNSTPVPFPPENHLPWTRITNPETLRDSIICILFSSGTTGTPKGVKLSHVNMVSQSVLVADEVLDYYKTNGPTVDTGRKEMTYPIVAHLPAAHIAGVQGYLVNWFYMGGTVYWMPRFDFPDFLAYTKKYKVTCFFSVPPVFLAIAKSPLVTDQFDHVEWAISGAAPMGKDLQNAARAKLGRGKGSLSQTWGLSETTGSITIYPRELSARNGDDTTGSVSMLIPNAEARIVDDEGKDVEPGAPGEIWLRGPNVFEGYWENEEANRNSFCDDETGRGKKWFMTGDVAIFRGGLFYIVDRKKVSFTSIHIYTLNFKFAYCFYCQSSELLTNTASGHRNSSSTRATKSPQQSWRLFSFLIPGSWTRRLSASTGRIPRFRGQLSTIIIVSSVPLSPGIQLPPSSPSSLFFQGWPVVTNRAFVKTNRAYVVPADPRAITPQEIIDWVAKQVSSSKRLRGGVVFLSGIPRSASGKILRKDLRVLAKKEDATRLSGKVKGKESRL